MIFQRSEETLRNLTQIKFCCHRFGAFVMERSRNSTFWHTRYAKLDNSDVSADPEAPWRVVFGDPFLARYVCIKVCGKDFLHLLRVQVFWRALCPPAPRP